MQVSKTPDPLRLIRPTQTLSCKIPVKMDVIMAQPPGTCLGFTQLFNLQGWQDSVFYFVTCLTNLYTHSVYVI